MRKIKNYNQFINEAIPYSDVKKFLEVERSEIVLKKLNEIFDKLKNIDGAKTSKRGDRIYIPYVDEEDIKVGEVQLEIESVLNEYGYKITDYKRGLCVYEDDEKIKNKKARNIKIGKVLKRLGLEKLLSKFSSDKNREATKNKFIDRYIVFSKHPYDIAGMSTRRGWSSCMNIYKKDNKDKDNIYIKADIEEGTIIAYLINLHDMNINKPKARILAKPFVNRNDENDIIYKSDLIHGTSSDYFRKSVDDILNSVQKISFGVYDIKDLSYDDLEETLINIKDLKCETKKEVEIVLNSFDVKNYTINDDNSVDVNGDVNISIEIDKIIINFNKVNGNFICSNNRLTTLEGSPNIVTGNFICSNNRLTTLKGGPHSVRGNFDCSNNKLNTLEGSSQSVNNFNCSKNRLTTLEGGPQSVSGDFDCTWNKLTTLEGGPKSVSGNFLCYDNNLTTLKGSPQSVAKFNCYNNKLTTLEGSPQSVKDNFDCSNNKLTTLKGDLHSVKGNFNCSKNRLTTLEGGPKSVSGNFFCYDNNLTTLKGSPQSVAGFYCKGNKLTTLEGSPKSILYNFKCTKNRLTTLEGGPQSVGGDFECSFNFLITLKGLPKKIGGSFNYYDNPVFNLVQLIGSIEYIETVVVNKKLNLNKLNSILNEMGKPPVDGIEGYDILN